MSVGPLHKNSEFMSAGVLLDKIGRDRLTKKGPATILKELELLNIKVAETKPSGRGIVFLVHKEEAQAIIEDHKKLEAERKAPEGGLTVASTESRLSSIEEKLDRLIGLWDGE